MRRWSATSKVTRSCSSSSTPCTPTCSGPRLTCSWRPCAKCWVECGRSAPSSVVMSGRAGVRPPHRPSRTDRRARRPPPRRPREHRARQLVHHKTRVQAMAVGPRPPSPERAPRPPSRGRPAEPAGRQRRRAVRGPGNARDADLADRELRTGRPRAEVLLRAAVPSRGATSQASSGRGDQPAPADAGRNRTAGSSPGEPPFDPDYDRTQPGNHQHYAGFDPGDEPLDDARPGVRESSEEQAIRAVTEHFAVERIGEGNPRAPERRPRARATCRGG